MKKESLYKLFVLVSVAGVYGFAPVALAEDEKAETPLGEQMDEISGALKSLRRLQRDPERWTKSAAAIAKGSEACIKAMAMVPKEIADLPDGPAKNKALADSRRLMGLTLAGLAELELAHLAEDEAQVDAIMEKLKDIKGEAHEKYNKEE